MSFLKLQFKVSKLDLAIKDYALQNNEVNRNFHVAIKFLVDLTEKSYHNIDLRNEFAKWLEKGSTIKLRNLLCHVGYKDSGNVHFNAFTLIDTVHRK
jgi:hypothetical protein